MCGRVKLFWDSFQNCPMSSMCKKAASMMPSCFNLASLLCHQACSKIYDTTYSLSLSLSYSPPSPIMGVCNVLPGCSSWGRYSDTVSHGRPAKTNDSTDIPYVTSNVEANNESWCLLLMYGCHWLPCGVVPVPKNNKKIGKVTPIHGFLPSHRRPAPPRINSGGTPAKA